MPGYVIHLAVGKIYSQNNKIEDLNSFEKGIVARNRNGITLCDNCLRITVGTAEENKQVIAALKNFSK